MANKKPIKKKKFSGLAKKTKFNPKHSRKVIKKKSINKAAKNAFVKNVIKSSGNLAAAVLTSLTPELENLVNETKESRNSLVDKYSDSFKAGKNGKFSILNKVLENENVKNLKSDFKSGIKNTIDDLKSGNIFGNKKAIEDAMTKSLLGDDFDLDEAFSDDFGDDEDYYSEDEEDYGDFDMDSGDDYNYDITDNRSSVKNNIYVANGVSNSVLGNMSAALIGSIASIKEDLVTVSSTSTEKSDQLIEIQNNINDNVSKIYEVINKRFGEKEKKQRADYLLDYFMTDGVLNPFKGITALLTGEAKLNGSGGFLGGMLDKDIIDMMLPMVRSTIQRPLFSLSKLVVSNLIPTFVGSFVESMQSNLKDYSTKLIYNFGKGKSGFGRLISNILGIDLFGRNKREAEVYSKQEVPFDGKVYKSITEIIPHYLARILSGVNALGKRFGAQSSKDDDEMFDWKHGYMTTRKGLLSNVSKENKEITGSIYYDVLRGLESKESLDEKAKRLLDKKDYQVFKEYNDYLDGKKKDSELAKAIGLDKAKRKKLEENFNLVQRKLNKAEASDPKSATSILSRVTQKFGLGFDIDEAITNSKGDKDVLNLLNRIKADPKIYQDYKAAVVDGRFKNYETDKDIGYGDLYDRRLYKRSEDGDLYYRDIDNSPSLGSRLSSYWSNGFKASIKDGAIKKSAHAFSTELSKIFFDNPNQGFFKSLKESIGGSIDNWITTSEFAPSWLKNRLSNKKDKEKSPEVTAIDKVNSTLEDVKVANEQVAVNTSKTSEDLNTLTVAATTNSTIYSHDTHIESKFDKFSDGFFKVIGSITGREYNPELGTFKINLSNQSNDENENISESDITKKDSLLDRFFNKVNKITGKKGNTKRLQFRNFVRNKILRGKAFRNTTEEEKTEMYERYLAIGYKKLEQGLFNSEQDVIDYAQGEVARREITDDSTLASVISRGFKKKIDKFYTKKIIGEDKEGRFSTVTGPLDATLKRIQVSIIEPIKRRLIGKDTDKLSEKDNVFKILSTKIDRKIISPLADKIMKVNDGSGKEKIKARWNSFLNKNGVDLKKLGLSGLAGGFLGTFIGHPLLGAGASMIITTEEFKKQVLDPNNPASIRNIIKRAFIGKHSDVLKLNNSLFDIAKYRLIIDVIEPLKIKIFGSRKEKGLFNKIGSSIVTWMNKNKISEKLQDSLLIITKEIKFRIKNFFVDVGNSLKRIIKRIGRGARSLVGSFIRRGLFGWTKQTRFGQWIGKKTGDLFKSKVGNLFALPFNLIGNIKDRFREQGLKRYYIGTDENGNPMYDTIKMRNDRMQHLDPNDPRNKLRNKEQTAWYNALKAKMSGMEGIINKGYLEKLKEANKNPEKYLIDKDGNPLLGDNGELIINPSYKPKDITPGEDLIVDTINGVNHAVITELRRGVRTLIQAITGKTDAEMDAAELLNAKDIEQFSSTAKFSGFKDSQTEKRYFELIRKKNESENAVSATDKAMDFLNKQENKSPQMIQQLAQLEQLKEINKNTKNIDENTTPKNKTGKSGLTDEEKNELNELEQKRNNEYVRIENERSRLVKEAKERNKTKVNKTNYANPEEAYASFINNKKDLEIVNDLIRSNPASIDPNIREAAERANRYFESIKETNSQYNDSNIKLPKEIEQAKAKFRQEYIIDKLPKEYLDQIIAKGDKDFKSLTNLYDRNTYVNYKNQQAKQKNLEYVSADEKDELQTLINKNQTYTLTKSEFRRMKKLYKKYTGKEYNEEKYRSYRQNQNNELYKKEDEEFTKNAAEVLKQNGINNTSESLIKKDQEKRDAERKDYNNRMLEAAEKTSSNTGSLNKLEKFFDKFRLLGLIYKIIKGGFKLVGTAFSKIANIFGFNLTGIGNKIKGNIKNKTKHLVNNILYGKEYTDTLEVLKWVRDKDKEDGKEDADQSFVTSVMALRRNTTSGLVGKVNIVKKKVTSYFKREFNKLMYGKDFYDNLEVLKMIRNEDYENGDPEADDKFVRGIAILKKSSTQGIQGLINKGKSKLATIKKKIDNKFFQISDEEMRMSKYFIEGEMDDKGITDPAQRAAYFARSITQLRKDKLKNKISILENKIPFVKKLKDKLEAGTAKKIATMKIAGETARQGIETSQTTARESSKTLWELLSSKVQAVFKVIGGGVKAAVNAIPFPINLIAGIAAATGIGLGLSKIIKTIKSKKEASSKENIDTNFISGSLSSIKSINKSKTSNKEIDPVKIQENSDKPIFEEGKKKIKESLSMQDKKSVYDDYYKKLSTDKYKKKLTSSYNASKNAVGFKKFMAGASLAGAIFNPVGLIAGQTTTLITDKKYYNQFKEKIKDVKDVSEINSLKSDYKSSVISVVWRKAIDTTAEKAIKAIRSGKTFGQFVAEEESDKKILKQAKKDFSKTLTNPDLKNSYNTYMSQMLTLKYKNELTKAYNNKKKAFEVSKFLKNTNLIFHLASIGTDKKFYNEFNSKIKDLKDVREKIIA